MFKIILPKFYFKVERWKWTSDYRIYVSNKGHFKNEFKQDLPIKVCSNGYCKIKTNCGYKSAHRLVMLTWKPIPDAENLTVDHLDHNKRNNELSNLEWVTGEENLKRAKEDFIQLENIIPTSAALRTGSLYFSSVNEAAAWVIEHYGMKDANIKTIEKRIKTAMADNKLYCGRKWQGVR